MDEITISGRKWKSVGRDATLLHDAWVYNRIQDCGLESVERFRDETEDAFARRIIVKALANPAIFELLGGLLLPIELDTAEWSPELAKETAAFLQSVRATEDKEIVKQQIVATITSFFVFGLSSIKTSERSSVMEPKPESSAESADTESGTA